MPYTYNDENIKVGISKLTNIDLRFGFRSAKNGAEQAIITAKDNKYVPPMAAVWIS